MGYLHCHESGVKCFAIISNLFIIVHVKGVVSMMPCFLDYKSPNGIRPTEIIGDYKSDSHSCVSGSRAMIINSPIHALSISRPESLPWPTSRSRCLLSMVAQHKAQQTVYPLMTRVTLISMRVRSYDGQYYLLFTEFLRGGSKHLLNCLGDCLWLVARAPLCLFELWLLGIRPTI